MSTFPVRINLRQAVLDSCLASGVALVLAGPLIGLHAAEVGGALTLQIRPTIVAFIVAAVFIGRLTWALIHARLAIMLHTVVSAISDGVSATSTIMPGTKSIMLAVLVAVVVFPFIPGIGRYHVDLATTVLIYVMLGWGLNIVVGLAGLLDLGYVAFYAVGAYTFAILSTSFGVGFWLCLPIAAIMAASFGILLGYPVLKLEGDYLAIVTLGFGEIIRLVLINWSDMTGGPNGIDNIGRVTFFGIPFAATAPGGTTFHELVGIAYSPTQRVIFLYFVILALALVTNVFTNRIKKISIGRAWIALREDEIACRSLGINPAIVKLSAFATGAAFAGLAGCFFATRQGFVSPESFTFAESAIVLAIVVLGGRGNQLGIFLAAALLVLLPEIGREFEQYRMVLFGLAMMFIMIIRPGGLIRSRVVIAADLEAAETAALQT